MAGIGRPPAAYFADEKHSLTALTPTDWRRQSIPPPRMTPCEGLTPAFWARLSRFSRFFLPYRRSHSSLPLLPFPTAPKRLTTSYGADASWNWNSAGAML